ncbi:MAG: hypothetical protein JO079_12100 [Frankiaceae bacterium]|nr:hypothetical protein [Frankiaceae bacterium]MBV9368438.1 hypothetical protein [Frankiales bacterium]
MTVIVLMAKLHASGRRELGQPDEVTDEVVTGLLAELRKWQAESAHWKAAAERLQRELDQR